MELFLESYIAWWSIYLTFCVERMLDNRREEYATTQVNVDSHTWHMHHRSIHIYELQKFPYVIINHARGEQFRDGDPLRSS